VSRFQISKRDLREEKKDKLLTSSAVREVMDT